MARADPAPKRRRRQQRLRRHHHSRHWRPQQLHPRHSRAAICKRWRKINARERQRWIDSTGHRKMRGRGWGVPCRANVRLAPPVRQYLDVSCTHEVQRFIIERLCKARVTLRGKRSGRLTSTALAYARIRPCRRRRRCPATQPPHQSRPRLL